MPVRNNEAQIRRICDEVRQVAYAIHEYLGVGHIEKVYENALANRLAKRGYDVQQQVPLQVRDEDGTILGDFYADLVLNGFLIVELKSARTLAPEHAAQVLGYLKASELQHALLINFGSYPFQIRKYIWDGHPNRMPDNEL